ncbi:GGDEF domain-containing protein [Cohnella zeiphila]|uniref:GGDEF domain-containing protein n=1 Tax=Cohnella zeiphila TaxID=2761120 RepID=A0A7X0VTQ7_9BACL|nr:GGDEF domain-containing protein [Cohnella zeiphila]MBB6729412.1 GGDEF domain-containing protein [Cohnella zeiphila]
MDFAAVWTFESVRLPVFSSGVIVILLGLMLFMAYRLYAHNRRSTYRKLIVSVGVAFACQLFRLTLDLRLVSPAPLLDLLADALPAVSFILLNFAMFELYHRRRPRTRAWYYALLGVCAALLASAVFSGGPARDLWDPASKLTSPVLDGFTLALPPLFALMFAPHIGQRTRYSLALAVSFAEQLAKLIVRYGDSSSLFYVWIETLLPIAFYILLFMIVFERVVELLQSAYQSSITDGLTNLYNRRFFMRQLEHAVRSGLPVAAIFCDIDNFKKLNDTQGHQQADTVLKQVANILMEETEGIGLAGRYGGEELVAFITGANVSPGAVAERIRERIEKETSVTASVGHCRSANGLTADRLMKQADEAMYHSKKSGKNRVTDYSGLPSGSL